MKSALASTLAVATLTDIKGGSELRPPKKQGVKPAAIRKHTTMPRRPFGRSILNAARTLKLDYYMKFDTTKESDYSCLRPEQVAQVRSWLKSEVPSVSDVVDVGANVGTDTVNYAKTYGVPVLAVEPDQKTFKLLSENMARFPELKLTAMHADARTYFDGKTELNPTTLVHFDPPWGGPGYQAGKVELKLGEQDVSHYIRKALLEKKAGVVVLKMPPENYYSLDHIAAMKDLKLSAVCDIKKPVANSKGPVAFRLVAIRKT